MRWLERNVHAVLERVLAGDPLIEECNQKREVRYQGMPRNIYRHIVLSDVKEATAHLPHEVTSSPVLSYDPLPPADSINSYTRPPRTRRVQESGGMFSTFFRSLIPTFDPNELVVEGDAAVAGEEAGAVGGQVRDGTPQRQSINALMTAMRAMLNRIQFNGDQPANNGDESESSDEDHDNDNNNEDNNNDAVR